MRRRLIFIILLFRFEIFKLDVWGDWGRGGVGGGEVAENGEKWGDSSHFSTNVILKLY